MEYRETAVIKLFCDFDFTNFPFDSHECHLTFGDEMYTSDVILLESSTVQYSGKGCKKVIPNMMHVCISRDSFKNCRKKNIGFPICFFSDFFRIIAFLTPRGGEGGYQIYK